MLERCLIFNNFTLEFVKYFYKFFLVFFLPISMTYFKAFLDTFSYQVIPTIQPIGKSLLNRLKMPKFLKYRIGVS